MVNAARCYPELFHRLQEALQKASDARQERKRLFAEAYRRRMELANARLPPPSLALTRIRKSKRREGDSADNPIEIDSDTDTSTEIIKPKKRRQEKRVGEVVENTPSTPPPIASGSVVLVPDTPPVASGSKEMVVLIPDTPPAQ